MTLGPIRTVGIYVQDQARALDFYESKLGFKVRRRVPLTPGTEWLEISQPGAETCLVLHPKALMPNWEEMKPSVVFFAKDVEALAERLGAAGVTITMPPTKLGWGTFMKFVDPDGNEFGVTGQPPA